MRRQRGAGSCTGHVSKLLLVYRGCLPTWDRLYSRERIRVAQHERALLVRQIALDQPLRTPPARDRLPRLASAPRARDRALAPGPRAAAAPCRSSARAYIRRPPAWSARPPAGRRQRSPQTEAAPTCPSPRNWREHVPPRESFPHAEHVHSTTVAAAGQSADAHLFEAPPVDQEVEPLHGNVDVLAEEEGLVRRERGPEQREVALPHRPRDVGVFGQAVPPERGLAGQDAAQHLQRHEDRQDEAAAADASAPSATPRERGCRNGPRPTWARGRTAGSGGSRRCRS